MSKNVIKADKLVNGAVSTFEKAIEEVKKANDLLSKAVEADETLLDSIDEQIHNLYKQADAVQAGKFEKERKILGNVELITKLAQFTSGGGE